MSHQWGLALKTTTRRVIHCLPSSFAICPVVSFFKPFFLIFQPFWSFYYRTASNTLGLLLQRVWYFCRSFRKEKKFHSLYYSRFSFSFQKIRLYTHKQTPIYSNALEAKRKCSSFSFSPISFYSVCLLGSSDVQTNGYTEKREGESINSAYSLILPWAALIDINKQPRVSFLLSFPVCPL
jgi:hypothetical protein